jgi:hypothetical protein
MARRSEAKLNVCPAFKPADKAAADGLGARLAFRCPQREVGETVAFTISIVSDCHATTSVPEPRPGCIVPKLGASKPQRGQHTPI